MKIAILCGGEGKRLRPFTEELPKTLVPINGKPILEHILRLYMDKNFNDFILCIGYKGEKIRDFVGSTTINNMSCRITFSEAGETASMLKRIYGLKDMFDDRIMVSYGDTLTNIDLHDFLSYHIKSQSIATIVAARIQNPFGLVSFDLQGKVESFSEKPVMNYYIGHLLLEKNAFEYMTEDLVAESDGSGLVHFFQKLISEKKLNVYLYNGRQITFNTHKEREEAEEMIKTFYTLEEEKIT